MFTSVVTALALVVSVSHVVATPVHHVSRSHARIARGYLQDSANLEDYTIYNTRYLALDCQDQHGTTFYDNCCHPLLKSQSLSDRPAECTPSASALSSASGVESSTAYGGYSQTVTTTQSPTSTKYTHTAQATTSASSGGGGQVYTGGQATWYTQDGTTGACGTAHGDYDLIVAADYLSYGDMSAVSPLCGKQVRITNTDNGKSVTCTIADACPGCSNANSYDMSLGAFQAIGDLNTGVLPISWEFV